MYRYNYPAQDHLVRWDGSPIRSSGFSRYLQSSPIIPTLAGIVVVTLNEAIHHGPKAGAVAAVATSLVLGIYNSVFNYIESPKMMNKHYIVIDKLGALPHDTKIASHLHRRARTMVAVNSFFALSALINIYAHGDSLAIASACHFLARTAWSYQRAYNVGRPASNRSSILAKRWTLQVRQL